MKRRRSRRWLWGLAIPVLLVAVFWSSRGDERVIPPEWDAETRRFYWGPGEVTMPAGFTYERIMGIDTAVGKFVSADGTIVIRHDIGEVAGGHWSHMDDLEAHRDGARILVRTVDRRDGESTLVRFPDSGCAQFYVYGTGAPAEVVVAQLTESFRPRDSMPGWVRYLTPAILKSDCRVCFRCEVAY